MLHRKVRQNRGSRGFFESVTYVTSIFFEEEREYIRREKKEEYVQECAKVQVTQVQVTWKLSDQTKAPQVRMLRDVERLEEKREMLSGPENIKEYHMEEFCQSSRTNSKIPAQSPRNNIKKDGVN